MSEELEKKKRKSQKLKKYVDPKGREYPNLYRDEDTLIFYVRTRDLGKITLKTDNPKIAIPKIYTAIEELKKRKEKADVPEGQNLLLRDIYDKMMALKQSDGIKESTLIRIKPIWEKSIEPFWGNLKPSDATQEKVDEFKEWHRLNRKNIQLVNVFKYLGNIFNLAHEYGHLATVPKLEIPRPEEKHHAAKKGRIVEHAEFESICENMHGIPLLITKIAYYMGMRKMEIGSLECRRILYEKANVYIDLSEHDTKTGIPRTIPVPDFIAKDLLKLKEKNVLFIFPMSFDQKRHISPQGIDRAWRLAKEYAEIEGRIRFHDLRHTAATNMARAEVNPLLAVTYLGMSLMTYQKRYLKLSKEDLLSISKSADKLFKKAEVTT